MLRKSHGTSYASTYGGVRKSFFCLFFALFLDLLSRTRIVSFESVRRFFPLLAYGSSCGSTKENNRRTKKERTLFRFIFFLVPLQLCPISSTRPRKGPRVEQKSTTTFFSGQRCFSVASFNVLFPLIFTTQYTPYTSYSVQF